MEQSCKKQLYIADDIRRLRADAVHYKLDMPKEFWTWPLSKMCEACNGAGPERWNDGKRQALTTALKRYEVVFAGHDIEYELKHISRDKADKKMKANMVRIWRRDFGFWRWFSRAGRIERLVIIPIVYKAVRLGGGEAYEA